jgi:hypothetical protein
VVGESPNSALPRTHLAVFDVADDDLPPNAELAGSIVA